MCLELSVKREKMSCMRVIDGLDPLACEWRMKAACELAGIWMTYAFVQPMTNLRESENAFVASYRIDMQMVAWCQKSIRSRIASWYLLRKTMEKQ